MRASRLATLLQIRPGEGRMAAMMAALFALLEAGKGFGANAADALFFLRFGVENLPFMFMLLGAASFLVALMYAASLGRFNKLRFFTALFIALPSVLIVERIAIPLDLPALYPILWLTIYIIGSTLGILVWNIAGDVCDARQAKRLFSLFVSAGILGGVVGNLITGPFAQLLGTENLLALYAALLLVALFLTRGITRRFLKTKVQSGEKKSILADVRVGYDFMRGSSLLRLMAYSSVLFSILYFSISFPFSKAVSAAFLNEAEVAGFLGVFSGIITAVTFFASLLVANRLYARIGVVNAILILPIVYLIGFILFAFDYSLTTAVIARSTQLIVLGGIAGSAWGTLFNVVPSEKRGQVIAFENGLPSQIGVMLSGLLLVLGERLSSTTPIFVMGMVVAAACGALVWGMRRSYGQALVAALRAGRFEVFGAGERALAGFKGDANAIRVAQVALNDPKPPVRRLAVEILARMGAESTTSALIETLRDPDPDVRVAAVRALGELGARDAASGLVVLLGDAAEKVRANAVRALSMLQPQVTPVVLRAVETLLRDPDLDVCTQAAVALARFGETRRALPTLDALLRDTSPEARGLALSALGEIAERSDRNGNRSAGFDLKPVIRALRDESAAVRRAACRALGQIRDASSVDALIDRLRDPDASVREAAAASLRLLGPAATARVLEVLGQPDTGARDAALDALDPADMTIVEPLHAYAHEEVEQARKWRDLAASIPQAGRVSKFLRATLETRAARSEQRLVKVVGLLGHREAMEWVGKSLKTRDAETRAAAVETLETLGDKHLAKEIIPLLEGSAVAQGDPMRETASPLRILLAHDDGWLRALAARAVGEIDVRELIPDLRALASNADRLARECARDALIQLKEEILMETLQTVSLMERILLLREVPLFADLSPDDLKQVADIAREQVYSDGALICREGEAGSEMFVLAEGQVRILKSTNGEEKLLATRAVGDFLGEMSVIESEPRFASVRAVGDVRTLVIEGAAFKAILRDRPEVSLAVLRGLSRRLRERE